MTVTNAINFVLVMINPGVDINGRKILQVVHCIPKISIPKAVSDIVKKVFSHEDLGSDTLLKKMFTLRDTKCKRIF